METQADVGQILTGKVKTRMAEMLMNNMELEARLELALKELAELKEKAEQKKTTK